MSLVCSKCSKTLTRKRARLIGAKLLCSACLFPATKGGVPVRNPGEDAA